MLRGECSEMQLNPPSPWEGIVGVLGVSILWLEDVKEEEEMEERTSRVSEEGVTSYILFIVMNKIAPFSPGFSPDWLR